jgi:hypothetical protein
MMITTDDVRACGFCLSSARTFFKRHNLDFKAFLKNGIDAEALRRCNDALANRVIDYKARQAGDSADG